MPDDKLDGGGPPQLIYSESPWRTVETDAGFMCQTRLCKADERRRWAAGVSALSLAPLEKEVTSAC